MDSYYSFTNVAAAAISFYALLGTMFFNRKSRSHQENKTMASSSSLTPLAPSSPHNWKHHVFPSFHGADVRENFLSHIVKEFKSKAIDLFIDNDIERSKSIDPELLEAIRGSRIAIVLLSRNYASSIWCLNELVEIIKCREEVGQTVMSLFYQVDPTHVKKQTGDFGKVFRKTCKGKTKEEIRRWKHALTKVAQIAGFHSTNGKNEAEMIEDIVNDVSNKLNLSAPSNDFDSLVGMESQMVNMGPLLQLDSDEVRIIGILGPPGIGKTTIARYILNRYSRDFQLSVFVENIKIKYTCSNDYNVKLDLQKHFMSQLTNELGIKIPNLGIAKDRLKNKKVLVIRDGVDRSVQVEAMAKEASWFGLGSRIIITTQDQKVLNASGINHIHKDSSIVIGINDETYEDIKCTSERAFERLYNLQFLRISSLGVNPRKFLVKLEMKNSKLKKLWEGMQPIRNLKWMDLSHSKILKELPNLSTATNLYDLDLRYCSSLVKLPSSLGNAINLKILNLHGCSSLVELLLNFETAVTDLKDIDLSHCSSLVKLSFSTRNAINLRRLNLSYCSSLMELPYSIGNATSLEELNLSHCSSLVKLPSSIGDVVNLKNLNLHHCSSLVELPSSIGNATKLQKLDLGRCSSLVKLPSSIGNATSLEELNLSHCSSLVKLPSSLGNLVNLKKLDLRNCSSLVELPSSIENAVNLMNLNLSYCSSLVELPSSIGNAISLRKLNLSHCSNLVELLSSIGNLTNLQEPNLSYCSSMVELPSSIGNLVNIDLESIGELDLSNCSSMESYHESSTDIQEFDPWTKSIYGLRQLVLNGMKKLVSLPPLPDSLWLLDAENCDSLERLDCSFRNRCFCHLHFINCFKLNQEARDLISLTRTDDYAVFPAEEVPTCFPYRSSGSSLTLKLNQMPLGKSTKIYGLHHMW
ncbi:hypothetical protein HID58_080524 [Brassica napus]|uniref:TIR domain-containing protein n=2 Tax=Brassica napus TaxID=3708 RepID=A0ABQ7Y554_BRANA|nr:hypothetical protein HID58_080524 [Brassica napus]